MLRKPSRDELEDPITRLDYVLSRCGWALPGFSYFDKSAISAAAHLLVCTNKGAKAKMSIALRKGGAQAYSDWLDGDWPIVGGPLPKNAFRNVYYARPIRYPHVVKIGITSDLDRRMDQLFFETGERHRVIRTFVGTVADEALAHKGSIRHHISREWFFDPLAECREFPKWLPMGPAEMRLALEGTRHEHA